MPIYAYRCEHCGHAHDVLQKISDPLLTVCPVCGNATYKKQVTAAGFQLKGSGWYVTDFRNNSSGAPPATGVPPVKSDVDGGAAASTSGDKGDSKSESKSEGKAAGSTDSKSETKTESKSDSKPAPKSDTGPAAA